MGAALHEGQSADIPIQACQRLHGQVRQAVQLALGQVQALRVPVGQKIHQGDDHQDHDCAPKSIDPAPVLAEQIRVYRTGGDDQQRSQSEVADRREPGVRIEQIGQTACQHQGRAQQAQQCGVRLHASASIASIQ